MLEFIHVKMINDIYNLCLSFRVIINERCICFVLIRRAEEEFTALVDVTVDDSVSLEDLHSAFTNVPNVPGLLRVSFEGQFIFFLLCKSVKSVDLPPLCKERR